MVSDLFFLWEYITGDKYSRNSWEKWPVSIKLTWSAWQQRQHSTKKLTISSICYNSTLCKKPPSRQHIHNHPLSNLTRQPKGKTKIRIRGR